MLKLYESIAGTQVLSLRSGGPIGTIIKPVINPNNLHIDAWFVEDNRSQERLILLSSEIREIIPQGFAVNDTDALSHPEDLVRLKDVLKLRFDLIGLQVNSESGKKYGKVNDYAYETGGMFIHKIYAGQSLVKNFGSGALSIDRTQIIEVTNRRIIIEDPLEDIRPKAASASIFG